MAVSVEFFCGTLKLLIKAHGERGIVFGDVNPNPESRAFIGMLMPEKQNPADEDPHGECRHEIERLNAELSRITSTWRCSCGATYSPEIARHPCDHSHRETWPHEWIGDRERELTGELLKRAEEIKHLKAENERLTRLTVAYRLGAR